MRIGTRSSALALTQARAVAERLEGAEIVPIKTSGDLDASSVRDKARWVDAIEDALLAGSIDLAVHSAKDLPTQLAAGLELLGAPTRVPAADAICGTGGLDELPDGARVGTSSLRRRAQLLASRPQLEVHALRGNVDTRLSKLAAGELDAIVLAQAGLQRLGREREISALLDPEIFVPSPGQGALALEGRAGDRGAAVAAQSLTDRVTLACLTAERVLARALGASCDTPLGAWCRATADGVLALRAWVGLPDGSAWIADELQGNDPERLAAELAQRMSSVGAGELLEQAEAMEL